MSDEAGKCWVAFDALLLIGGLTMVFASSWQMFAAAASLCVGTLAVAVWKERR